MISKITKGWNAPKLIGYLMGPGRYNEHTRPTVIAAWHHDPGALQPALIEGGSDFDYAPGQIRALGEHLNAAADAVCLARTQPAPGRPGHTKYGYVWHCSITLDPTDGVLKHDTWAAIASEVMAATGIAPAGDPHGCRWIGVHHGPNRAGGDHIHLAAVLVRQDTGRRYYPRNDYAQVRAVMRRWETRLQLRATAAPHSTRATPHPGRGETEKAARRTTAGRPGLSGAEPGAAARVQLRQVIREAAALATGPEEFLKRLRTSGILVHLRREAHGRITGWAVADPADVSARTGQPIWWSVGRDIAADLSWPRLTARWTTNPTTARIRPHTAHATLGDTATGLRDAASRLRASRKSDTGEHIAYETYTMFAAYAAVTPDPSVRELLHHYEHTLVAPGSGPAVAARFLRQVAADLAALRTLLGVRRDPVLELTAALAELALEIARWHHTHRRPHHATEARALAASLTSSSTHPPPRRAGTPHIPHPHRARVASTGPPRPPTARSTPP